MDEKDFKALANVRLDRAKELYVEARELVKMDSYKSANNRAFYAIEKCIKALLAMRQMDVETHNGAVSQFNLLFIHTENPSFTKEDYQKIAKADRIRNASDYDDFYVVSVEDAEEQMKTAEDVVVMVEKYLKDL